MHIFCLDISCFFTLQYIYFKQAFRSKTPGRDKHVVLGGEVIETLKRIQETKNVIGTMVINHDGIPIKSSIDSTVTAQVLN